MAACDYIHESLVSLLFRCLLAGFTGRELYLLRDATDIYHAEHTNASKFALPLLAELLLKLVCVVLGLFLFVYFAVYERTPANQRTRYIFSRAMDMICGGLSVVLFSPFFIANVTGYGAKVPKGHVYDAQFVLYDIAANFYLSILILDDCIFLARFRAPRKQERDDVQLQSVGTPPTSNQLLKRNSNHRYSLLQSSCIL